MNIEEGFVVINNKNNKFAIVEDIRDKKADIHYIRRDGTYDIYENVPLKHLTVVEPYALDAETVKKIIRLEIKPSEYTPKNNVSINFVVEENIDDCLRDFYYILRKFKKDGINYGNYNKWYRTILKLSDFIEKDKRGLEKWMLSYIFYVLYDIDDNYDMATNNTMLDNDTFDHVINSSRIYFKDINLPLSKKKLSEELMKHVMYRFDEDTIDNADENDKKIFKECVNRLCEKDDKHALQKKGYCLYCNTSVFPENWKKCRDIFEKHYKLTGNPFTANTLGYIYYYGRANNGVGEYDKAFKYFSIGNAFGVYESTYKLADCFRNGYGVIKNDKIAHSLYLQVIEHTKEDFINGEIKGKFADAALRMAICYQNGIGVEKDEYMTYYWYLLAEYAIKLRTQDTNYYGDSKVAKGINESISLIRKSYDKYKNKIVDYLPPLIMDILSSNNVYAKIKIKGNKDKSYNLELTTYISPYGNNRSILVSIPEFDYCGFVNSINYHTAPKSKLTVKDKKKEFIFNYIYSDWEDGKIYFEYNGEEVASLSSKYIELKKIK